MNMQRDILRASNGFRVYGTGTSIMDLDNNGTVVYSNLLPHAMEYKAMFKFWLAHK